MMSEDGETRDDLKITEYCTPSTPEAVRELLKSAEAAGERLMVIIKYLFFVSVALRLVHSVVRK